FVSIDAIWRNGIAGSVPSMAAYVAGVSGIFHLLRARTTLYTAAVGAGIYALNPSLLYMQSTAMTESIFLAAMIWSVVHADEFRRALFVPAAGYGSPAVLPAWRALERCGLCLGVAILTRYDGWIFAAIIGLLNISVYIRFARSRENASRISRALAGFIVFCALLPILWFAHNYRVTGHPLDWL